MGRWPLLVAVLVSRASSFGTEPPKPPAAGSPAEETRLPTAVFRAGLQKRGLTELLELHLKEFPPADAVDAALMLRNVKLAEAADVARSRGDRQALQDQANRILEKLIEDLPNDARCWDWRLTLARSLLFDEAEAHLTHILYRGGTDADRRAALNVTSRAVRVLRTLSDELAAEYRRLDQLSVPDFEQLESSGHVERIDRLTPQIDYLFVWALFYDAVPRPPDDAVLAADLHEILARLESHASSLTAPHPSRPTVTLLALSGMTHRRLQKHDQARDQLERAISLAAEIRDPGDRQAVRWVVTLAWFERIRNDADLGRFDEARRRLTEFRNVMVADAPNPFALTLNAALLERNLVRRQIDAAKLEGRGDESKKVRDPPWKALLDVLEREPHKRREVYAAVHELTPPNTGPADLDPVEQCALLAGLLAQSEESADKKALLDRAVAAAEHFLKSSAASAPTLVPEVLYQLAAAEYRLGRVGAAARRFLEVARDYPAYDRADAAAGYAVQLAADLRADPAWRAKPEVTALFRESLDLLTTRNPASEDARQWSYAYAELLEELGEYEAAVEKYAAVTEDHERAVEAKFSRLRCLANLVHKAAESPQDAHLGKRTNDFVDARRALMPLDESLSAKRLAAQRRVFVQLTFSLVPLCFPLSPSALDGIAAIAQAPALVAQSEAIAQKLNVFNHTRQTAASGTRRARSQMVAKTSNVKARDRSCLAEARVISAEIDELPHRNRWTRALAELEDFEQEFPAQREFLPRAYRCRLLALERLGRIDEARNVLKGFETRDLEGSLPTINAIYSSLEREITSLRIRGDERSAQSRATLLLDLANSLAKIASAKKEGSNAAQLRLAEAHLLAGLHERACELFDQLLRAQGSDPAVSGEPAVCFGYGESLFQLRRYAETLSVMNRLALQLSPEDPLRWKSLLRDLQSRTALGQPAAGILAVLQQQKQLHPALGGPAIAAELERLERENQRRRDAGS